jgi:tetratricopeptide (TPR) repeat protein
VESIRELRNWALCERICAESLELADLDQALELAGLALEIAERARLETAWSKRLQGYAWAHLGNARRRSGDQDGAEEAFNRFHELWEKGEAWEPELLDAERVRRLVEG